MSSWRRIVTGQTVLTIFSSWLRPTMNAASFSNFHGGWVDWRDQGHPLLARDLLLPLVLFVDDDRVGREAEHADDLGVVRGAEQDDRVALVDELVSSLCSWMTQVQVPSMTSRPRWLARSMTSGRTPWARITTAAPWSTSSSVSTVSMPEPLEVAITPSLWTTWPRVWVALPAARASLALSIASRTP